MTLRRIREIAKDMRIKNYGRFKKPNLIKAIQQAEGNTGCFKEIDNCGEVGCLWREECQERPHQ